MFSNSEIPMFYRYEHYMSISYIALILNMVHILPFVITWKSFLLHVLNNIQILLLLIASKTTMGELNNSPADIFDSRPSPMSEEVLFDLSSSSKTIPPAQKPLETPVSWSSHCVNKKSASDYERDRVEKYASYFKGWRNTTHT